MDNYPDFTHQIDGNYIFDNDFMTIRTDFPSNSRYHFYLGFISNRNIEYVKILFTEIDNNNNHSTLYYLKIIAIFFIIFDIFCILIYAKYFRIYHSCYQN